MLINEDWLIKTMIRSSSAQIPHFLYLEIQESVGMFLRIPALQFPWKLVPSIIAACVCVISILISISGSSIVECGQSCGGGGAE